MNILSIKNVTYQYEGAKKLVLKGVNAEFSSGKIYTIVGKSGAGKSTLLSLIAGLDVCSDGEIIYKGTNLKDLDRDEGKCVIIVTHSKKVTSIADEVWGINDGKLLFVKNA